MQQRVQKEKPAKDPNAVTEDDDEPDEWDKRINKTGCAVESEKLNDCFHDKKDWRLCKDEMKAFRECWAIHGNDSRTSTKNADE
ncbi:Similar to Cytochrome oxidase assembly factor 4; acc. no. Q05809 [Pyronema omphalodes CBS 100304]|uniref:Similar to Cytochrome oxidase assembly factor 4 acc. no. Q05809 n=1 Tax=Pyronema omphalodes (strain CBS 100304) TaxID=1076935 RepID=U4LGU2_PYROM|nr:Similar to Cytochrome oxidase assembly factor 4; acc. no. Q05809 [Pyronema omphalodes CBS 100304]